MRIEDLIDRTKIRIRLLRTFRWSSWGLLFGLSFSAIYLALTTLGLIDDVIGSWLFLLNLGIVVILGVIGFFAPINTNRLLYQLDKSLKTGEVLLTLYDMKQRKSKSDFVSILERRFIRLKIRPDQVFSTNSRDWKRGGGILAVLGLVLVLLWFGPSLLELTGLNLDVVSREDQFEFENDFNMASLPENLLDRFSELEQFVPRLGAEFSRAADGEGGENPDNLIQLFEDLERAQNQALGLSSNNSSAVERSPKSALERQQQREQLRQLQQQLQRLQAQLANDPSNQDALDEAQAAVQRSIQSLDENDPLRETVEQALSEEDAAAQQQALEQAQQQLNDRLNRDEQLESLREALEEWASDESNFTPEDLPEIGDLPEDSLADAETVSVDEEFSQNPSDPAGQSNDGSSEDENSPQDDVAFREGEGDEPGTSESGNRPSVESGLWQPEYKNAQIPQSLAPASSIEEWLSRGVPVETEVELGQPTQYRLSYDQVESLLDLRDLSPEMQDVVRLYFLQIIGQLNEVQQVTP